MNRFQEIILTLIRKEGNQQTLAKKLKISSNYVSMLANGKRPLSKDLAQAIKDIYKINVDNLILEQSLEKLGVSFEIKKISTPENISKENLDKDIFSLNKKMEILEVENVYLKKQIEQYNRSIDLLEKLINK